MSQWLLPQLLQTTLYFFQAPDSPTAENSSVVSGIQSVIATPDQLWKQCFTDSNLESAKNWLLKQNRGQDHSDTWDYVKHWALRSHLYSERCTSVHWMN